MYLPWSMTPVLLYHRIARSTPAEDPQGLDVSPEEFARQMRYLARNGYTAVGLNTALGGSGTGSQRYNMQRYFARDGIPRSPLRHKSVVITFDDGYLDTYQAAFPILQEYGFTATVFLVTDFVGKLSTWDSSHRQHPLMDWAQVKEMSRHGISFQSHTRTHPELPTLGEKAILAELLDSRLTLEDALGVPILHHAYPYGRFDQRVKTLARRAGYLTAWAAGLAEQEDLCRERMQVTAGDGGMRFAVKASGWAGWARRLKHAV